MTYDCERHRLQLQNVRTCPFCAIEAEKSRRHVGLEVITDPNDRRGFDARLVGAHA